MPFRAYNLKIGSNTFIVPNVKGAHTVEDQKLGPSGPVEFTWKNPKGEGLLGIEEGIEFVPNKYLSSKGADAAFPGQVLIQPQATTVSVGSGQVALVPPVKQIDATFSSVTRAYLVGSGNTIFRTNTDTPPVWTSVGSLGGEPATDIILHGGIIGVAHGSGFRRSTDGATWTADTNDADVFGYLGTNDSTNAPLVWRVDRPNSAYSSTALNGTWSSSYTVGDSQFNVNSMLGIEQVLLIGKDDGIYSIDADGQVVPFTPELRTIASSSFATAARVTQFNGDYYFATDYGIVSISGADGGKKRVGLDQLASPDIPTPQVRALCSDDRYLYALVQNTSNDLMILRRTIYGAWHVFYWDGTSGTKTGQHIAISSALGYPALFFSYFDGSSTYTTKAIRLSVYPNPLQDSNYRYDTTNQDYWIRLGRFGPTESNIVIDRCTVLSENLTANITIAPYLSTEGAAVAAFGSAATSSPYTEIKPATAVEGKYFDAYVYLDTNSSSTSPVLKSISFKGWLQPGMRRVHQFVVAATGAYQTPEGDFVLDDPVTTINNLQTLRTTDGYVTVVDEHGQEFSGYVFDVNRVSVDLGGTDRTPVHTLKVTVVEKS